MAVIDAHVHLWDPARHRYPWLDREPSRSRVVLHRAFMPTDLDRAAPADIDGVVVVEAGCHSDDAQGELEWIEKLATEAPRIRGVVAQVRLEEPDAAARLDEIARRPLVVGIRRNLQDEPTGLLNDADFEAGMVALTATGLPFDACIREHQLPALAALADRHPQVMFVLDHVGKPDIAGGRWQPWGDELGRLARRPNVCVKLSGLTTEADHDGWKAAEIEPYLRHALDAFGPDRCMFGSDWPVMSLATRYIRWLSVVLAVVDDLPAPQRAAVLGGTAARVYGIDS